MSTILSFSGRVMKMQQLLLNVQTLRSLSMIFTLFCVLLAIIDRLLELTSSESVPIELKIESVVIFGSLAKGPDHVVQSVFESGIMPLLLKGIAA